MVANLASGRLISYMLISLPMAMIGIPIYMHIPSLFSSEHSVSLTLLGSILLFTRLLDTVSDPLLGIVSDRLAGRGISRTRQMVYSSPFFLAALWALVSVPPIAPWLWLTLCLVVLYVSLSAVVVNYYALGTDLAEGKEAQLQISTRREGMMIFGILLGSLAPAILIQNYGAFEGMRFMAMGVIAIAAMILPYCFYKLKGVAFVPDNAPQNSVYDSLGLLVKLPSLRWLFGCYAFNAVANGIPATLIFFYMTDVLGLPAMTQGVMLAVYFLSAIIAMPLWNKLAVIKGAAACWQYSVLLAAIAFVPAAYLGIGDRLGFAMVCMLTGVAFGADMAMPASMLSLMVQRCKLRAATCFGMYHLLGKLALALAAGTALPLLDTMGYAPASQDDAAVTSLAYTYALLPALIKLIAAFFIMKMRKLT